MKSFYPGQKTTDVSEREIRNRQIAREAAAQGMVLLENDGILPLSSGAKVALFGLGARHTIKGGSGSGDVNSRDHVTVEQGLLAAGYRIVNREYLDAFDAEYEKGLKDWEKAIREAAGPEKDAMKMYQAHSRLRPRQPEHIPFDAAECAAAEAGIYVITRTAGEGADRFDREGDYYLTPSEREELGRVCAACRKVIVILNVGGIIDLGFLEEYSVAALVLMGQAGVEGGSALADVLGGKVNPSGRLTDSWARHYEDYPSSANFSHRNGNLLEEFYTDGIYVGYRYFDTFGVKVRYPFGYGLSYTSFERSFGGVFPEGEDIAVRITVRNTGRTAGRQVVLLFVSCPAAEQKKELKRLAAFGKTRELQSGEAEELVLRFQAEQLASFRNGSWVLEKGDYLLIPGFSGEDCEAAAVLTLEKTTVLRKLAPICELVDSLKEMEPDGEIRKNLEKRAAGLPRTAMDSAVAAGMARGTEAPGDPLLERGREIAEKLTTEEKIKLVVGLNKREGREIIGGAAYAVPGAAGETAAFPEHGVPGMVLADGPAGLRLQRNYEVNPENGEIYTLTRLETMENRFFGQLPRHAGAENYYQYLTAIPTGTLIAQTFDPSVPEKLGEVIAEEMREFRVAVWLAPGMNIHRNPLCGRNFEYYSEDPLISGIMAAAITRGVQKEGDLAACIKHFACNNQEDDRFHVTANVSQRALREIYLKGFEIAVKTAHPLSIMTSYNRINSVHTANSRDLCTVTAREEWGFRGFIMTDWTTTNGGHGSSAAKCILAGNDLVMPGTEGDREEIRAALRGDHDRPLTEEKLTESAARLIGAALQTRTGTK